VTSAAKAVRREVVARAELTAIHEKFKLWRWIVTVVLGPFWIAALLIPLRGVQEIASVVAGKQTDVRVAVTITVGISIALTLTVSSTVYKIIAQRRELKRLRTRIEELEGQLVPRGRQKVKG
jgi:hypothetical protein